MIKGKIVYEGRSKIFYESSEEGILIQHFKDNMRWLSQKKKEDSNPVIFGKGVLNNRISAYLMTQLDEIGLPTHFIKAINMREQLIWDIQMLPFQIVVRNLASKEMEKRFGVEEGAHLPRSIVEFQLKNEKLTFPTISDEHIITFGWADQEELEDIYHMALRVNDFLTGLFLGLGLKLADVTLEFGRIYFQGEPFIILGDEICPDNCRLWRLDDKKELPKENIGNDLDRDIKNYQEIARLLGLLPEGTLTPDTKVSTELLDKLKTANEGQMPIKPGPYKR